jgi:hypothetical protein
MKKPKWKTVAKQPDALFERVVSILEQARGNVVRACVEWKETRT